jgi:putative AdoMet-dependent methyltransferase
MSICQSLDTPSYARRRNIMLDNKGFDLWADGYDKAVGISEEANTYPFAGYKEVLGGIFQEILSTKGAKVLDIGFGTGTLTTKLYENGCEVYGQDFSSRMIELAKAKMPNAKLYQGDFTKGLVPELNTCKFDYIIGTYSMHHLSDAQKKIFFRDLLNQLNEGGKLIIGDVAFNTRDELEKCKSESGDDWDDDEIYFVIDELRNEFPNLSFEQKSYCSGIISIQKL